MSKNNLLAWKDLKEGIFGTTIWFHLAWQEVRQRYHRSLIGPFWITISTGVMIGAMGPLYGRLLNQPLGSYFQHLSVSFIVWSLIAGYVNDVCTSFINAESFIKQVKLPYSIYVMKVLARNLIMFCHNLVIVILVLSFFPPENKLITLLSLVGVLLLVLNLLWIGLLLAVFCARFRDIAQIVASVMQVLFFMTPIMWSADMLGSHRAVADWNPLYHLIEVVRTPLLGGFPSVESWLVVSCAIFLGSTLSFVVFARFRSRISYWI